MPKGMDEDNNKNGSSNSSKINPQLTETTATQSCATRKTKKKYRMEPSNNKDDDLPDATEDKEKKAPTVEDNVVRDKEKDPRGVWARNVIMRRGDTKQIIADFKALKVYKAPGFTCTYSKSHEDKNRYTDVDCNDQTRVVLKERVPNQDDYINANWINVEGRKYICTQAPVEESVLDFWHMIYTEKSDFIVMLCNIMEGCAEDPDEKSYRYFPTKPRESISFPPYKISTVEGKKPTSYDGISVTTLKVEKQKSGTALMTVKHYWSESWMDHCVPKERAEILWMMSEVQTKSEGPITVHCSDDQENGSTRLRGTCQSIARAKVRSEAQTIQMDQFDFRHQAVQSAIQLQFIVICLLELYVKDGYVRKTSKMESIFDAYSKRCDKERQRLLQRNKERVENEKEANGNGNGQEQTAARATGKPSTGTIKKTIEKSKDSKSKQGKIKKK
ncbi:hypothetical protein WR25_21330 [Diploscapter pachys]|uniref:Tyrosine-protein phosphatase domain-containing protein n=1 Tax=Diploscapter pachys TaxID=2018661 RepID=A0A2A2J3Z9_9BILA|nr:hypothetical protein WR25_21330 [Diploscapter pachys]